MEKNGVLVQFRGVLVLPTHGTLEEHIPGTPLTSEVLKLFRQVLFG